MADETRAADTATPTDVLAKNERPAWPLSSSLPPFGALLSAPRMARAHLRGILALWDLAHLTEQAEYVVSELVTNAVNASTRDGEPVYDELGRLLTIALAVRTGSGLLRIEVWDRADGVPTPRDADDNATSGRGLAMVAHFSSARWGWTSRNPQGWKSVHAVLGPDPVQEPGLGSQHE
jgi:anti-sigma regulatory factor (Ser/Thr protein kinase)